MTEFEMYFLVRGIENILFQEWLMNKSTMMGNYV